MATLQLSKGTINSGKSLNPDSCLQARLQNAHSLPITWHLNLPSRAKERGPCPMMHFDAGGDACHGPTRLVSALKAQ
jgi:hypothetical protein